MTCRKVEQKGRTISGILTAHHSRASMRGGLGVEGPSSVTLWLLIVPLDYLAQVLVQHSANRQLENIHFPMEKFLHHPNMDGTVTVRYSTFVHRDPHRRRAPFPFSAVSSAVVGRLRSYGNFWPFFLFLSFFFFFPISTLGWREQGFRIPRAKGEAPNLYLLSIRDLGPPHA